MRILITGAAGNLGGKLVKRLSDEHELVLLDLDAAPDSEIHAIDLSSNVKGWAYLFKNIDVVIHFAANSSHLADWPELIRPNIDAVLNVYNACALSKVPRVVYASSSHVYGSESADEPIASFDSNTIPLPSSPYGSSKLFGEQIAKSFLRTDEIFTIILRLGWNAPITDFSAVWVDEWLKKIWISDRDFHHLVDCCLAVQFVPECMLINGISANKESHLSLLDATELLGYQPRDNAFDN